MHKKKRRKQDDEDETAHALEAADLKLAADGLPKAQHGAFHLTAPHAAALTNSAEYMQPVEAWRGVPDDPMDRETPVQLFYGGEPPSHARQGTMASESVGPPPSHARQGTMAAESVGPPPSHARQGAMVSESVAPPSHAFFRQQGTAAGSSILPSTHTRQGTMAKESPGPPPRARQGTKAAVSSYDDDGDDVAADDLAPVGSPRAPSFVAGVPEVVPAAIGERRTSKEPASDKPLKSAMKKPRIPSSQAMDMPAPVAPVAPPQPGASADNMPSSSGVRGTSKGPCGGCGEDVTENDDRAKMDGKYWHKRCIEPSRLPQRDKGTVKGMCGGCNKPVYSLDERERSDDGTYYHRDCAIARAKGKCGKCGVMVYDDEDRAFSNGCFFHKACVDKRKLAQATQSSKGECGECRQLVYESDERMLGEDAKYYHASCAQTARGACGKCAKPVFVTQLRAFLDGKYYHVVCVPHDGVASPR